MPTTYNGIGTHYYGRRRQRNRQAVCQICGRPAQLSTYETRLWFVVVFVPLIPLSRRKIVDQCGVCQRHYAFPLRAWETGRLSDLSAAVDRFRREPCEESAANVHGQLLTYQELESSKSFRQEVLEQFSGRAEIRAALAWQLESSGLPDEAEPLWDEAVELEPELPAVRIGLGRRALVDDKLDEAREHLRFLEEPGAEQQYSLDALFDLAAAYQRKAEHEPALEIMQALLAAFPDMARDHQIRAFVLQSEKALRRQESILSKVDHSIDRLFSSQYSSGQRWGLGLLAALILAVVGALINNEMIRRGRELTVINDTGQTAEIRINGQDPVMVDGLRKLPLSEGEHVIQISGPVESEHRLTMQTDFWRRWTDRPVWILNIAGEALIADMQVYYAVRPQEPSWNVLFDPVVFRRHVDYPFEEPPDTLPLNGNSTRTVSALSWIQPAGSRNAAYGNYFLLKEKNEAQALRYLLKKIVRNPGDSVLVNLLRTEWSRSQESIIRTTLSPVLDARPLPTELHEFYQDLPDIRQAYEPLRQRYTEWLNQYPDDASLLYLTIRFEADPAQREKLLQRARKQGLSASGLSYLQARKAAANSDWDEALRHAEAALDFDHPHQLAATIRHTALIGAHKFKEAESHLQELIAKSPDDLSSAMRLAEIHAAQDRREGAGAAYREVAASLSKEVQEQYIEELAAMAAIVIYLEGDLDGFLKESEGVRALETMRYAALLERSSPRDVWNERPSDDDPEGRWAPLQTALGAFLHGDASKQRFWRKKQISRLESDGPFYNAVRRIIEDPPAADELPDRLAATWLGPDTQAMILLHLASLTNDRSEREKIVEVARQKLIRRVPPYGLLRKVQQKLLTSLESEQ